jgi:hypothetical protein
MGIANYNEFLPKLYTRIKPRQQSTDTLIVDCKVDSGLGHRALTWSEADLRSKRKEIQGMKKSLSLALLAIILVASLGFVPAAYADDASTDVNATGIGKLEAQGDGIAILYGKGTVELSGNGILWIKDAAGNARIEVTGYGTKTEFSDGWVQYSGLRGNATIKGTSIRVVIAGVEIDLDARGRGGAILWGHGTYEINGRSGDWGNNTLPRPVIITPAE